ncbi:pyrroline-5-carboxylate reductase [Flavobacterium sp. 316]|uniref:Pyrroline-5-carboxylate reductase n=1 Tax=Flavobacterium sediminilitoris TaxID=2024526 RepID=A0ABY4HJD0_9FLAO|nr:MULTISPECIES: pyrroline-5-carboxylate reductase [Flavobacterium]KIX22527.1 pyrroline-5-carboxylate reductase [Flavobacterium sp. 316]UOX32793.1 pyrroline-5-carboxylate reductase [Flavobacterium sediminilitoris]
MKTLIIGYGNMGQTYANSFVSSGFVSSKDIFILSRSEVDKKQRLSIDKANFHLIPSFITFDVDIIILAVKPQDFNDLVINIKPFIKEEHVILSVMAGITIETIQNKLNCKKVVRSMPNIPTQIGLGMTVFSASSNVDRKELFIIQNLINTTGKSIYIEKEEMLNAATAVSGSGPAYVFYFMNAMIQAAIELGFTQSEAEFLVNQTFIGAVQLQNRSKIELKEWIVKVSSKGGTTEAALEIFNQNKIQNNIQKGIKSANKRAEELGKNQA